MKVFIDRNNEWYPMTDVSVADVLPEEYVRYCVEMDEDLFYRYKLARDALFSIMAEIENKYREELDKNDEELYNSNKGD